MTKLTQRFADNLVRSHPDHTAGQLLALVAPERRAELARHLRYVPPREDPRLRRKRERIRTPMVMDLEKRLAAGVTRPRPTGPVNTGGGRDQPSDPKEGGA